MRYWLITTCTEINIWLNYLTYFCVRKWPQSLSLCIVILHDYIKRVKKMKIKLIIKSLCRPCFIKTSGKSLTLLSFIQFKDGVVILRFKGFVFLPFVIEKEILFRELKYRKCINDLTQTWNKRFPSNSTVWKEDLNRNIFI